MTLELQPHIHGNWQLLQVSKHEIDVTCKDSAVKPQILVQETKKVIFEGSLTQCQQLLKANNQ
jgi:hypothetical protein